MLRIIDFKLPKEVFGKKPNLNLLAQAIHVYEERAHVGLRKTQTRAEVNRTTKKIYRQKGTGGARHGSRKAPIFVGGGVALGPRPVRRILNLPKSLRDSARIAAFSAKADEGEVKVVGGLAKIIKTGEVSDFLKKNKIKRATFAILEKSKDAVKFLRNLPNVSTVFYKDVTAFDIWRGGTILIDESVFEKPKAVKKTK